MTLHAWIYSVELPNGDVWGVPVEIIARNRADYYKDEFDNDIERSLSEDTVPLFVAHPDEIGDWAGNNMNWSDVEAHAKLLRRAPATAEEVFQEAWMNGPKEVIKP